MIRDLRFDEIERAHRRKRTFRLVAISFVLSITVTVMILREKKIADEFAQLPSVQVGDLASLQARHGGIQGLLDRHHIWTGAYKARAEFDALVLSIHEREQALAAEESERLQELTRIKEEAEAARQRGLILANQRNFDGALGQFKKALELCDSLGENGWGGSPWEHRDQVVVDIYELEKFEGTAK